VSNITHSVRIDKKKNIYLKIISTFAAAVDENSLLIIINEDI